jgi:chaperonin cofactor prefoldin
MQELQTKLNELLELQESYCNIARNDEALNDEIRELQKKLREFKK